MLGCDFIVNEFELQLLCLLSDYYPWEKYEHSYPPAMGQIVPLLFFFKEGFGIK